MVKIRPYNNRNEEKYVLLKENPLNPRNPVKDVFLDQLFLSNRWIVLNVQVNLF